MYTLSFKQRIASMKQYQVDKSDEKLIHWWVQNILWKYRTKLIHNVQTETHKNEIKKEFVLRELVVNNVMDLFCSSSSIGTSKLFSVSFDTSDENCPPFRHSEIFSSFSSFLFPHPPLSSPVSSIFLCDDHVTQRWWGMINWFLSCCLCLSSLALPDGLWFIPLLC